MTPVFDVADGLQTQSSAIDTMYRDLELVVGEMSVTTASWAVHECYAHSGSNLRWHDRPMRPEDAQIENFVMRPIKRKH